MHPTTIKYIGVNLNLCLRLNNESNQMGKKMFTLCNGLIIVFRIVLDLESMNCF